MSTANWTTLWKTRIAGLHLPTGKTRHYRDDSLLQAPCSLSIAQYAGDAGFYLLYLDDQGRQMTDTYHDTVERAMHQAEFEFGVPASDWQKA